MAISSGKHGTEVKKATHAHTTLAPSKNYLQHRQTSSTTAMMRSPLFFLAFLVALVAVVAITQQSDENVGEPNVSGVIKTFFAKWTGRAVSTSKSSLTRRFVDVSAIVLPPPLVASASPAFYQTISSFFFTDQPLSIKEDDNEFVVSKRLASTVDPAKLRVEVHREEFGDVLYISPLTVRSASARVFVSFFLSFFCSIVVCFFLFYWFIRYLPYASNQTDSLTHCSFTRFHARLTPRQSLPSTTNRRTSSSFGC